MKRIITLGLSLCIFLLATACNTGSKVKPLTAEDIKTYTAQMNENQLSGDITLNGVKYSLPVKAQDLINNGWKYNDFADKGNPLKNGYYTDSVYMDDGLKSAEKRITITLFNTSGDTVKFDDAMLGGIEVNKIANYKNNIVLPKGITLDSTYDDVIKAYGKPQTDLLEQAGWIKYSTNDIGNYGQSLQITFDKSKKTITAVKLKSIPSKQK